MAAFADHFLGMCSMLVAVIAAVLFRLSDLTCAPIVYAFHSFSLSNPRFRVLVPQLDES